VLAARAHPLLGPPTWNVGTIHGGDQPSTVPARCIVQADRRTVPGETWDTVQAELREILAAVESDLPGLRTELGRVRGGMATLEHVPLVTAADHPLALAVAGARDEVEGSPHAPVAFPAWTDGALLAGFAGIPAVVLGPGDLGVAHSPREHVPLAQVEAAARIYALAARRFGAGDPG
jgi:acetylornithine deacetylase/succinyl-diaminopimelate desuccinylase-like protein